MVLFCRFQTHYIAVAGMEVSFTLEQQDENDLMQASEKPFDDNLTVCKCKIGRFMVNDQIL